MERRIYIGTSNSSKFHLCCGPNATYCNARSGVQNRKAAGKVILAASEKSFCKKCFPNGKPNEGWVNEINPSPARCPKCGKIGTLYPVNAEDFSSEWATDKKISRHICGECVRG